MQDPDVSILPQANLNLHQPIKIPQNNETEPEPKIVNNEPEPEPGKASKTPAYGPSHTTYNDFKVTCLFKKEKTSTGYRASNIL